MKTSALYKEVAGIETSLKLGVPLSQQLREERKIIEKTAIGYQKGKGEGLTPDERQGITPLALKIPHAMAARFRALARAQNISQRELFRRALTMYFKEFEDVK
jgi:hypothetical protein